MKYRIRVFGVKYFQLIENTGSQNNPYKKCSIYMTLYRLYYQEFFNNKGVDIENLQYFILK